MNNSKKIKKNLITGVIGLLVSTALGIVLPRLVLTNYGSEINGLLTSVTNIFAYIAIVEAGIAAASCQALYKSIADNERKKTNEVLAATNRYYCRTGYIYLLLFVIFSFGYPLLVNTEIPYCTIVLVVFFNGFGNVINYFFHGKYLILLKADGSNYVRVGIETCTNALKQLSKIVLIALGYDIILVQFVAMLISFGQMICVILYVKKRYSWIDLKERPDYASISQSKHVVVHEINYVITSNLDIVLLTIFSTLKTVSVYSLYVLFYNIINNLLRSVREAFEFRIAHEFYRNRKRFLVLFEAYETYYTAFAFAIITVACFLIVPFLKLYTVNVTDTNYVQNLFPYAFGAVYLLQVARYPSDAMVHIAGYFQETKKSAIIETIINLILSLALVRIYGIFGVLLGTIISALYRTIYEINYVNRNIIGRTAKKAYKVLGINFSACICILCLSQLADVQLGSYTRIFAFAVPYSIVVLLIYIAITSLYARDSFRYVFCLFVLFRKRSENK